MNMTQAKLYGATDIDHEAELQQQCYDIVKAITAFGVNDAQIIKIIYLLGLNITDNAMMRSICDVAKSNMRSGLITTTRANALVTD